MAGMGKWVSRGVQEGMMDAQDENLQVCKLRPTRPGVKLYGGCG